MMMGNNHLHNHVLSVSEICDPVKICYIRYIIYVLSKLRCPTLLVGRCLRAVSARSSKSSLSLILRLFLLVIVMSLEKVQSGEYEVEDGTDEARDGCKPDRVAGSLGAQSVLALGESVQSKGDEHSPEECEEDTSFEQSLHRDPTRRDGWIQAHQRLHDRADGHHETKGTECCFVKFVRKDVGEQITKDDHAYDEVENTESQHHEPNRARAVEGFEAAQPTTEEVAEETHVSFCFRFGK